MQVNKESTLAEIPLIDIRDFLRRCRQGPYITVDSISERFGVIATRAELILQAMVEARYIKSETEAGEAGSRVCYSVAELGSRLCVARFVKRITRARADELVKQMLSRADEINARDELVYSVKRIRAFGSYASDASEVGDVDLAVELEQRYPDRDIVEQSLARADSSGKRFGSYLDQLSYAQREISGLLKARSPYLSIQDGDCPEKFGAPAIDLWPDLLAKK